jgi:prevent-host-death family protein
MKNQIVRLTATEAARDFSALLDRIETGQRAIIERHSKPVALIVPAPFAARRLSESAALPLARPSARLDGGFEKDLEVIISGHRESEPPAWA